MIYTLPPIVLGVKVYWKMSTLSPCQGHFLLNHDCWEKSTLPKTNLAPKPSRKIIFPNHLLTLLGGAKLVLVASSERDCSHFRKKSSPLRLARSWNPMNHQNLVVGFLKPWCATRIVLPSSHPRQTKPGNNTRTCRC